MDGEGRHTHRGTGPHRRRQQVRRDPRGRHPAHPLPPDPRRLLGRPDLLRAVRRGDERRSRDLAAALDNPERLGSEASFAALCGVSPVERSSGSRQFRRLNCGGDRQANAALHRIVQTRLRVDPRTRDYYEPRIKEGKTRREIVRCLKRYAAREVFHLVRPTQS